MTKCKFCTDGLEYAWTQVGKPPKWRLCNEITGAPHQCKRDAPQEISHQTEAHEKKEFKKKEKVEDGHSPNWKKDWTPETKTYRICGDCNDGRQTIEVMNCDCGIRPCNMYCPKCEKHPRLSLVTSDPKKRL